MFTLLFYTGACAVIAGILTVFTTLFRPIHKKGDSRPWLAMLTFFVLVFSLPYAYTETISRMYGDKMKTAIRDTYDASEIQGPMHYYRLVGMRAKEATAIVIGSERESWGGTDRPVLSVHLVKEGDEWKADSYKIVYCERLNKDGYTFPPYW